MLLVILLLVLVFYLNKLTRAHNKGGWWIGFILPPHFWSPWLLLFLSVSHSVYLWFSPCCAVEFYRFVALWPFVSAMVEFLILFAHVYLFLFFLFNTSQHSDLSAVILILCYFFQFISYCFHSWQLCPAIKCSQLFSTLVWHFLFLIPSFWHTTG